MKLNATFLLTVLAAAALVPLVGGINPEMLAISSLVILGSTVFLDRVPSLKRSAFGQLGEVGENAGDKQKLLDKLNELDHKFREVNDRAEEELKQHGQTLSDTRAELEQIKSATERLEDIQSRLDDIEAKQDVPVRESENLTREERDHVIAFEDYLRHPKDGTKAQALLEAQKAVALAKKDVTTTVNANGGYGVPEVIAQRVGEKVQEISRMRGLVRVVSVGTSDYKELIDVNGESYGWVGETDSRSKTNTPQLEECAPTMGTLYAYVQATEESLDDIFFDVTGWLINKAAKSFARGEGAAFISGNGTNKPTGFLNGTPVATGDEGSPERAYQTLQYIPTGVADGFGHDLFNGASPSRSGGDVFITAEYSLKPEYRANGRWLANKSTLGVMRRWKNADGDYVWQRSLQAGQPSLFMGYPVEEMADMPDIGANAFPVAFGDFMEGYLAVDRTGLRTSVDNNITTPGYVKWYLRRRQGGAVYNDDAIKLIKCATS